MRSKDGSWWKEKEEEKINIPINPFFCLFQGNMESTQLKIEDFEGTKSVKLKDLIEYMESIEKTLKDYKLLWHGLKKSLEIRNG